MKTAEAFSLPVYKTEDYSIFSKMTGNRELNQNHVRRLAKAIKEDPEFTKKNPLLINGKMEVVDGQHRIAAYEMAVGRDGVKYPVYYVVHKELTLSDARKLNANHKSWGPLDYAHAYAADGNKHYRAYLTLQKQFASLPHQVIVRALGGTTETALKDFRHGLFTIRKKDAEDTLTELSELLEESKIGAKDSFGLAFFRIRVHPMYEHDRMLAQIKKNREVLHSVPSRRSELAVALNTVYNLGHRAKVDLLINRKQTQN